MLKVTPRAEPDRVVSVVASFGLHTFTKDRCRNDPTELHMGPANDPRSFCSIRHALSLNLPAIIRDAANGRVCFTHNGYFLLARNLPSIQKDYAAILKFEKGEVPGIDVRMFVISAHLRMNPFPKMDEINFVKLVTRIANGETNIRPK